MSRKQSDYLQSLLADEEAPPPEAVPALENSTEPERPTSRAGMSLLGRENALARVASGEVRQVTQLLLDPARVRIWSGNARLQARLSENTVRDLIDSILAEGRQKMPAIVRRVTGDAEHDYEVIAGTRRHFAISWLRAHSYPDMKFLVEVADLDDEAAFRLADIENRARKDVSDVERAQNYSAALKSHYGGHQTRMSERLKLSKGWLSKMLKVATLPEGVIGAFADLSELPLSGAYGLALAMDNKDRAKAIAKAATVIRERNEGAGLSDTPPLPGSTVLKELLAAGLAKGSSPELFAATSGIGRPLLSVTAAGRQGITLKVHAGAGASEEELVEQFRKAVAFHSRNGLVG